MDKIKVLYICPFAHYSGHHPHVATVEPQHLANAGIDVTLLTFDGIANNTKVNFRHIEVFPTKRNPSLHRLLESIKHHTLPRWALMLAETILTLRRAIQLKKQGQFDILHLRDGDPFLFLAYLMSLPHKNCKWAISTTAAIIFKPKLKWQDIYRRPLACLYSTALYLGINNMLWKPLYKWGMRRNSFVLTPQNQVATESYKAYMGGVFKDNVECIEWGIDKADGIPSAFEARQRLGIPQGAFVLLSFGAPHSGRAFETIFQALAICKDAYLVHGGTHTFSLGSSPVTLAKKYNLNSRAKIFNYYIPEEEKPYFFACADVAVLSYTKAFASTSSMIWECSRFGLPVISSNANTLGEDVRKYRLGLLFEAEDAEDLVRAIARFRSLPSEEVAQFKENCQKFIEDFSDKRWAKKYISVYERLLNG